MTIDHIRGHALTPAWGGGKAPDVKTALPAATESGVAFAKFAAGIRAMLAMVAVFTLIGTPQSGTAPLVLSGVFVYVVAAVAAVVLAAREHPAPPNPLWYWGDAVLIVLLCSTSLRVTPGAEALLILPIIALALHFSMAQAVGLATMSAVALTLPHLYPGVGGDAFNVGSLAWAQIGIAVSLVASGPVVAWLLAPTRDMRSRDAFLSELAAQSMPRQGLAVNVQRLFEKLQARRPIEGAMLSLGGMEPRVFAWSPKSGVRVVEGSELASVMARLKPVTVAMAVTRHDSGEVTASTIDAITKPVRVDDARPWLWVSERASSLVMPLPSFAESLGYLWLSGAVRPFSRRDVVWLGQVMAGLMPMLERADLMEQLQREGAVSERERIGRDLHDSAVQPYVGLKYGLEALERVAGPANPVHSNIRQLLALTNDELQNLRSLVSGLRAGVQAPSREAPMAAIERQVRRFETIYGLKVHLFAPQAGRLHGALAKHVLHIINEALTNVRRHTAASAVNILIDVTDNTVNITLRNERKATDAVPPLFVPTSIEQRTRDVGGTLKVQQLGGFTELHITIPALGIAKAA